MKARCAYFPEAASWAALGTTRRRLPGAFNQKLYTPSAIFWLGDAALSSEAAPNSVVMFGRAVVDAYGDNFGDKFAPPALDKDEPRSQTSKNTRTIAMTFNKGSHMIMTTITTRRMTVVLHTCL